MPRLFSYGTLRQAEVQEALFGRRLNGRADSLRGYRAETIVIADAGVVATSGSNEHSILRKTGEPGDRIDGLVFDLSDAELCAADAYETDDYARVEVTLESGLRAFVYVRPEAPIPDAGTRYTCDFVRRALPGGAARVLEIGCGDGALAALLQSDGLEVVALDADEDAVASARVRGVDARMAEWPAFEDGRFDAVLFTRSLHHMDDLPASIEAARACLRPGGRIIVEDFDFDYSDAAGFDWFRRRLHALASSGVELNSAELLAALDPSANLLELWRAAHDHQLHGAAAIAAALGSASPDVDEEAAAYFFRYLDRAAPDPDRVMDEIKALELEAIAKRQLVPLGRRFVAPAG